MTTRKKIEVDITNDLDVARARRRPRNRLRLLLLHFFFFPSRSKRNRNYPIIIPPFKVVDASMNTNVSIESKKEPTGSSSAPKTSKQVRKTFISRRRRFEMIDLDEIVALKRLKMEKEKEGFPITSLREICCILKSQHENVCTVRVSLVVLLISRSVQRTIRSRKSSSEKI